MVGSTVRVRSTNQFNNYNKESHAHFICEHKIVLVSQELTLVQ